MKNLSYSNAVYKVNMKNKKDIKDIIKIIVLIILAIFLLGVIYQKVSNFIAKETLKEKVEFTRVDEKRLDYLLQGNGSKYTIIFDGNIGSNLNQWDAIIEELLDNYDDISTFVYNRRGYGFSDSGSLRSVKEQAEDLRILLRKSATSAPYILVGEEYGSLVLTEFAKAYPDLVSGIVLVNPLIEEEFNSKEFQKNIKSKIFRSKFESIGSSFGLTSLLDKLNLTLDTGEIENNLDEDDLEEFLVHRTKKSYNKAVNNEFSNLMSGENSSQVEGIFSEKPYYLIAKKNQKVLSKLGDEKLTTIYEISSEKDIVTFEQKDNIITGIRKVIKRANEIERVNK